MTSRNTVETEDENLNSPKGLNTTIQAQKPQLFDTLQQLSVVHTHLDLKYMTLFEN